MNRGLTPESLRRVVIENVRPEIDGGRFPVKRCPGESITVQAQIHADGSDVLAAVIQYRLSKDKDWQEVPLESLNAGKDLWQGRFTVEALGRYDYTLVAWIDSFGTWRRDVMKKSQAGQEVSSELLEGARIIRQAAGWATGTDSDSLRRRVDTFDLKAALDPELSVLMAKYPDRSQATTYKTLGVLVERDRARYGAWYEMFPRSAGNQREGGTTLQAAQERLMGIAKMGFDILYLPPIHPIGKSFRKGPNNSTTAGPSDPGSPWAIGSSEGGHQAIDPALGTLQDFDNFVKAVTNVGMEIALDLAFQCSPDHPYVREHPEWFRHRPDGTIKYAENPPKKYEDIYPFDFECDEWQALWQELKEVVLFWAKRGVQIFRVDNPHTKPYRFWEWLIREVQEKYPKTVFLAEAFTRPAVMQYLGKVGFSQSYTYFTWRNTKPELTEYFTELTQTDVREYMRPNLFANTPDILTEYLQTGGRPAFAVRLILAATLGASYGIYGPPYELCEARAFPGTEDYVDSEKYQVRQWDWDRPGHLKDLITQVNRIRRDNPALHLNNNLRFYSVDNPNLLFYGKQSLDGSNTILVVVNLDPHHAQEGSVQVPKAELGLPEQYSVEDLLTGALYHWRDASNYVKLDPAVASAHILRVKHGA